MAMDIIQRGATSGTGAEVDLNNNAKVALPLVTTLAGADQTDQAGGVRIYSEVDTGVNTGAAKILSPEADDDYRLRVAHDTFLDQETFNYTAQNTGKHTYANTTLTAAWNVGNFQTNSGSATTTTTGLTFGSYAYFPLVGTATLALDAEAAFSAQPTANTVIDFGFFLRGAANPYAPTDGAYFRLTSAGLQGVINYNGTETTTSVFSFAYTNNKKYQFILYCTTRAVEFWINNGVSTDLYGVINTPSGNGQPFAAASLPFSVRHSIVGGAAGGVIQFLLSNYNVRVGGAQFTPSMGDTGNRIYGAHQGLSGGTMGSLANYANSANPSAAVPTNTTAALGTGLGGQFWETASLAVNTDGIICSFQNPAGTVSVQGRRLKIKGVGLVSYVQTVIVGGPFVAQFTLAVGHTAVSLATAEAATTKAPRRVPLPFLQVVSTAQAVSTVVAQQTNFVAFDEPIYVNPGEFVALVTKHVGTVGTSGTIAHMVMFDYSWE